MIKTGKGGWKGRSREGGKNLKKNYGKRVSRKEGFKPREKRTQGGKSGGDCDAH